MFFHSRILRRTTNELKAFNDIRLKYKNPELYQQFIENIILINRFLVQLNRYLKSSERSSIFSDQGEPVKSMRALYKNLKCLIELIDVEDYEHFLHTLLYLNGRLKLLKNVDETISLHSLQNEILDLESRRPVFDSSYVLKDAIGASLMSATLYLLDVVLLNPMVIIPLVFVGFYFLGVVVGQWEDMYRSEVINDYRLFCDMLNNIDRIIDESDEATLSLMVDFAHRDKSKINSTYLSMTIRSIRDSVAYLTQLICSGTPRAASRPSLVEGANQEELRALSP